MDMADLFARYDFTGVNRVVLYGMAILTILLTLAEYLAVGYTLSVVWGIVIPWALAAPYNMRWARLGKLNVTWAFAIGTFFGLLGLVGYWIYYKVKGGDKGGVSRW